MLCCFLVFSFFLVCVYSAALQNALTSTSQLVSPSSVQTPVMAASTSASLQSEKSFVLYLPAKCEQECVNNAGSYYCKCRAGYKLNPDLKTCSDVNECDTNNGGCSHQCINLAGSFYCACLQGQTISSDNKTCVEPGVDVTCTENYMQIYLERAHFKNFDPSYLSLRYSFCSAVSNSTHFSLKTPLDGCGTTYNETNDKITFFNEVKAMKVSISGVVTRSFDVSILFYCEYSKSSLTGLAPVSFRPFGVIKGYEGSFGNFTFRLQFFRTSAFKQPYSSAEYPINVKLNDPLYIQYSVESLQKSLDVFAESCKATPSLDPYAWPQYVFLRDGCFEDPTMTLISNHSQPSAVKQFAMTAFKFLADHPEVYIHCRLMACHKNTVGSRCSKGCQRYAIRKRRDLISQKTETLQPKETNTYDVPSGALRIVVEKSKESSGFDRAQATLVGSISGAGAFFMIIVIILAVFIVKKGYIKKFKRRNKVDDIYSGEDTRTIAYVNEELPDENCCPSKEEGLVMKDDLFIRGEDKIDERESGC